MDVLDCRSTMVVLDALACAMDDRHRSERAYIYRDRICFLCGVEEYESKDSPLDRSFDDVIIEMRSYEEPLQFLKFVLRCVIEYKPKEIRIIELLQERITHSQC